MSPHKETTLLSVRSFPAEMHQRLRVAAVKRKMSMAELLAEIVGAWLEENERGDD